MAFELLYIWFLLLIGPEHLMILMLRKKRNQRKVCEFEARVDK